MGDSVWIKSLVINKDLQKVTEVRLGWYKLTEGKYVADGLLMLTKA